MFSLLGIFLIAALSIPKNSLISLDSNSRAIAVGVGLLIYAITQLLSQSKKVNFHSVDVWWIILIVFTGLSSLWSLNASYALYGMFTTIMLYCCFSAYQCSQIKAEENINPIFWVAFVSLSFILLLLSTSLINFIAADNLSSISKSRYARIIFRNSDLLISVALLIAPYVAFTDKKVNKRLAPILLAIMLPVFLAIQPLKASLIIGFLTIIYILFNAKLSQINKYIILGGSIFVLFLCLVYGPVNKIVSASQTRYTTEMVDQKERIQLWKNSINLAKESPLFGHGKNNWKLAIGKYGYEPHEISSPIIYPKNYTHSFNIASQLLSELGIIGIIIFLYIAVLPCFRLINERQVLSKLEVAALISVVTFLLLGLVYGSPLNYFKNIQGPVLIAFIGLAIINEKSNKSTVLFSAENKVRNLLIVLGAILTIAYFGRIQHAEKLQSKALRASLNRDYTSSEKLATKALNILPDTKSYQLLFQSLVWQERDQEATNVIYEGVTKDPFNISLLYIYGEQLIKAGDIATAKICSEKIKKIAPHYIFNHVLAAKIKLLEKPTSNNYQKLIQLKTDLHNFTESTSQEVYVPEFLYTDNVIVEIARFLVDHKSKVYKHIN